MRTLCSVVTGLVAVLALAVALPLGWLATHIADEDGYVDFTSSLVQDDAFRAELVTVISDAVIEQSGVPARVAPTVRSALGAAASRVVDSPRLATVFGEAQRQSHRAVFGAVGDAPPELEASDGLVIDLAPVATAIIDALTADLPVSLSAPQQLLVTVGGSEQRDAVEAVDRSSELALAVAAVAVLATSVSLLAARRRSVAISWLGIGAVVAASALHLAASQVVPRVIERGSGSGDVAGRAQQLVASAATDSLDQWLLITAIAGTAALVVGLAACAVGGRG